MLQRGICKRIYTLRFNPPSSLFPIPAGRGALKRETSESRYSAGHYKKRKVDGRNSAKGEGRPRNDRPSPNQRSAKAGIIKGALAGKERNLSGQRSKKAKQFSPI